MAEEADAAPSPKQHTKYLQHIWSFISKWRKYTKEPSQKMYSKKINNLPCTYTMDGPKDQLKAILLPQTLLLDPILWVQT